MMKVGRIVAVVLVLAFLAGAGVAIYHEAVKPKSQSPPELDSKGYYREGLRLESEQKYSEAIAAYEKGLELNPLKPLEFLLRLFYCYRFQGDLGKAATQLEEMMRSDPEWTKVKILVDYTDEENKTAFFKRYEALSTEMTEDQLRALLQSWMEEIKEGKVTIQQGRLCWQ